MAKTENKMVSAVVLSKNEQKNIEGCLKSLSFCDEIIIVDDYSEDKTLERIKKLKSINQNYKSKLKIFKRELNNNFASQRNFGLSKVKTNWILFIDADERVPESLASEILKVVGQESKVVGYFIRRLDIMWGKPLMYGESGSIRLLRLAKRNSGKWVRKVHEYWDDKGPKGTLKNNILHYPHPTLSEFIKDINRMSTIHASENLREGKKTNLLKILTFPTGHFFKNYILKLGFLDGTRGFVFALIMRFHSFLAWSKQWMLSR